MIPAFLHLAIGFLTISGELKFGRSYVARSLFEVGYGDEPFYLLIGALYVTTWGLASVVLIAIFFHVLLVLLAWGMNLAEFDDQASVASFWKLLVLFPAKLMQ